jgi:hypothetical protein
VVLAGPALDLCILCCVGPSQELLPSPVAEVIHVLGEGAVSVGGLGVVWLRETQYVE